MQRFAEKGDWRPLLALLPARGENRLFSPEEVRPICFCGSSLCSCPLSPFRFFLPPTAGERVILSLLDSLQTQVFRLRRKTDTKQKQIASGRRRCAGASGLFIRFRKLQKTPRHFFIFNSERFAARAPRITTTVKQERLKRTVLPKGVNVPRLLKETAF